MSDRPPPKRRQLTKRLVEELKAMVARAELERWDLDYSGPAQELESAKDILREVCR